jgi:nucleoside-diphosphate-sugar epimerase
MGKMLITGASGFVGQALCHTLRDLGTTFTPVTRARLAAFSNAISIGNIDASTDWLAILKSIDTVVHLAARVHLLKDLSSDKLSDYRIANVDSTLNLARQCAQTGVKRLIYLSSVKVNGEATTTRPFFASDKPAPQDPYGVSKFEAEQGLKQIASETGLEVVIIRPPLVYGPRVKANFLQMMGLVKRGVPLPFANIENRRSLVFVGNLVDLIVQSVKNDNAAGQIFMVSDGHDVSTEDLIRAIAAAMNKRPMLLPVPSAVLHGLANLVGKKAIAERVLGSLQVDIAHTLDTLHWSPPYSFEYGIEQTVKYFLHNDLSLST